ncbi:MAG: hypothetical protein IH840_06100 [Candidatus Heimdallarchaeota archaeon]|nr:hypothetical protein [Candidatus Heimdallarchaeota archaeon]
MAEDTKTNNAVQEIEKPQFLFVNNPYLQGFLSGFSLFTIGFREFDLGWLLFGPVFFLFSVSQLVILARNSEDKPLVVSKFILVTGLIFFFPLMLLLI